MALSTLDALFSTVVLSSNRCPLSGFLSFGTAKSHRGLCRDCTEVVEAMRFCVHPETAAQDSMNALARYRGEEASHRAHASHS